MLFWTIALIVALLILICLKLFSEWFAKKHSENIENALQRVKIVLFIDRYLLHDYSMQAIIGIIATILGITLGLHLSNIEEQKNNTRIINQLLSLTYNDISSKFAEFDLFYEIMTNDIDSLNDYIEKKPTSIDSLLDNELSRELIEQEVYMQMLDIRANLYSHISRFDRIDHSEEVIFLREIEKMNLYYEYFQRTVYVAFLCTTNANIKDDLFLLMRTNSVWFIARLGMIDGMKEQDAFNSAALVYMDTYPDRLLEDGERRILELTDMQYPKWLFLKDT